MPLLVLEIWGVAQLGLLAMIGWRQKNPVQPPDAEGLGADLVITATFHSADELERTLVACQSVEGAGRTLVALRPDRSDLTDVADRFDVGVLEGEGNHVDLFRQGVVDLDSSITAWLEAGQMPMRDFLTATLGHFADPTVAIVQAKQGMLNKDSLANMRGGRDEDAFRSEVAYPAQGARGDATWTGGGSLVRAGALASIGDFPADQAALARAQVKLQAAGWLSRFYGDRQLLLDTAPDSLESYLLVRRRRAIESLRVFTTAENPLRYRGLSLKQRLDHVAFGSTYLASIRQLGLTIVLVVALLTGAVPFGGSARVWASLWLSQFVLGTMARKLLARGTMGFGDWTRQGWRTLSSDLSAIASVTGLTHRTIRFRGVKDTGVRSLSRMRLVSTVLVAMNSALIARGLTVFLPRMLPRFTTFERVMILVIALVVVGSMIDVLQVAVRRTQRRASYRLNTRLVGYLDGVKVRIVDLTPNGLGARTKSGSEVEVGSTIDFNIGVPGGDEGIEVVKGHGHVRSVTPQDEHDRIGIEFERLDNDSRARLIDYCAVGHHSLATHDTRIDLTPAKLDADRASGRGMKVLSGSGVFLGILVLLAGPAALPSLADVGIPTTTCLTSSTGAPLSGGQVSFHYDGAWNEAGATGEDGCLVAPLPPQKTTVAMTYQGVRLQVVQDLALSPDVTFNTMSGSVLLQDSTGQPLAGGVVNLYAGGWREIATTNNEGRVTFELLAANLPIALTYEGVRQQITHNYTTSPEATFNTMSGSVLLQDSTGQPLAGGVVNLYAGGWREIATTNNEGRVTFELLAANLPIALTYEGVRQQITHNYTTSPEATFNTMSGSVLLQDSTGQPLAGGVVNLYAGGWREIATTNNEGRVTFELLAANLPIALTYEGVRQQITHNYTTSPEATFNTMSGSVLLQDSTGQPLAGGVVNLYAGGWREIATTNNEGRVTFELLAANLPIALTYEGVRQQITHNYTTSPEATFNTMSGSVLLQDSTGQPLAGGVVNLYAGGWREIATTNNEGRVTFELLAANLPIALTYEGVRQQITHNYTTSPEATFNTVAVYADEGVEISKYYQSGWRTFADGVELLPSSMHLLLADGSRAPSVKLQAGVTNYVPSGRTAEPSIEEIESTTPTKDIQTTATTTTAKAMDETATTTKASDRATTTTTATDKTTTTGDRSTSTTTTATDKTATTRATDTARAIDKATATTTAIDKTTTTGDRPTSTGDSEDEENEENEPGSSTSTVLVGETAGSGDEFNDPGDESAATSEGSSATASTAVLTQGDEPDELAASEEQSSVAVDAASEDITASVSTEETVDQPDRAQGVDADNELPPRIELADGVYLSETEPIVAGLTVTLEPLADDEDTGTVRYAIQVENPGAEKLAGPVTFRVEVDNLSELHIESSDRWRCEQRDSAVECISDADVEPRTSYTIIMSTTLSQTGRPLQIAAAFVAVLLTGSVALGISRRRSMTNEIEEVGV